MSKEIEWIVQTGDARLDKLVAEELPELTRSAVQNLISQGLVFCNGEPVLKSARPVRGDRITVRIPEPKVLDVEAENIPLEIVYEDADLLVEMCIRDRRLPRRSAIKNFFHFLTAYFLLRKR